MVDPIELELDNINWEGVEELSDEDKIYTLILMDKVFANVFFYLSVLHQLQTCGFIGEYVKLPKNSSKVFWDMWDSDFRLTEDELTDILNNVMDWDQETKDKTAKFYHSYVDTDYFEKYGRQKNT